MIMSTDAFFVPAHLTGHMLSIGEGGPEVQIRSVCYCNWRPGPSNGCSAEPGKLQSWRGLQSSAQSWAVASLRGYEKALRIATAQTSLPFKSAGDNTP